MTVLIFANGDVDDPEWIRPYLKDAIALIAADGGVRHLLALDCLPDILVGDMDSLSSAEEAQIAEVEKVHHPAAKDETDLELALAHASGVYEGKILVFGAFGGRVDQTLANTFLLAHPALNGRRVELVGRRQRLWMITPQMGSVTIAGQAGDKVSLLPCGQNARIARTANLRWPLTGQVLAFGPARGVSNEMTADEATVKVENGRVICVHLQQSWQR
jgi:thiamine pyrophosphokinase